MQYVLQYVYCQPDMARGVFSHHTHTVWYAHCCAVHNWPLCCAVRHKGPCATANKPGLGAYKSGTTMVCQHHHASQAKRGWVATVFRCCPATCDCCQGAMQRTACRAVEILAVQQYDQALAPGLSQHTAMHMPSPSCVQTQGLLPAQMLWGAKVSGTVSTHTRVVAIQSQHMMPNVVGYTSDMGVPYSGLDKQDGNKETAVFHTGPFSCSTAVTAGHMAVPRCLQPMWGSHIACSQASMHMAGSAALTSTDTCATGQP